MRLIHAAALTGAAMLLASIASAQGLGSAAAREREKRKAEPAKPAKVYTDSDLGNTVPITRVSADASPADAGSTSPGAAGESGQKAPDPAQAEKEEAEQRAKAVETWTQQLTKARQEEQIYKDLVEKAQQAVNDPGASFYSTGHANTVAFLEEQKQKLAQTQQRIAALEEEGRRNRYR